MKISQFRRSTTRLHSAPLHLSSPARRKKPRYMLLSEPLGPRTKCGESVAQKSNQCQCLANQMVISNFNYSSSRHYPSEESRHVDRVPDKGLVEHSSTRIRLGAGAFQE